LYGHSVEGKVNIYHLHDVDKVTPDVVKEAAKNLKDSKSPHPPSVWKNSWCRPTSACLPTWQLHEYVYLGSRRDHQLLYEERERGLHVPHGHDQGFRHGEAKSALQEAEYCRALSHL
jgi:hypothetical protein